MVILEARNAIGVVNKHLEIVAKNFFANSEKDAKFYIFLGQKNFWGTFVTQKLAFVSFLGLKHHRLSLKSL